MKYLKDEIENFEVPLDNIFDPEYPDWGADDRGMKLYKSAKDSNVILTYGFNNEYTKFEMYIESTDEVEDLPESWQKNLLYEVCRTIPEIEDFEELIDEIKYFVLQLHMEGAPEAWSLENPNGNIGIFIGMENKEIETGQFKIINIKLMRPAELLLAIKNGEEGKLKLAELYAKETIPTNSSMQRKSVV